MARSILDKPAIRRAALPLSPQAYRELGRLGAIPERTELLAGMVIEKMPKDPLHSAVVARLHALISRFIASRFMVRQENPLTLGDSEPEPDLALVDHRDDFYAAEHPRSAHWVVEVSNTTLELDREKATIYARAGIEEYWIINLSDQTIEVHKMPAADDYAQKRAAAASEELSPRALPELKVRFADLV